MSNISAVGNSTAPVSHKNDTGNAFDTWFEDVLSEYASKDAGKPDTGLNYHEGEAGDFYGPNVDEVRDRLRDELSEWVDMSLAEKLRAQYLEAHGLTEGDLEALPPDEREAIEDAIADYIKEEMKRQAGVDGRRLDTDSAADLLDTATAATTTAA
ncbi:DUF3106 domain-containing protein [Pseudomonas sp. R2.Fl]|nr:DUF3106 domain-containing protein [Pseudomonas sp. R2.Fl]